MTPAGYIPRGSLYSITAPTAGEKRKTARSWFLARQREARSAERKSTGATRTKKEPLELY